MVCFRNMAKYIMNEKWYAEKKANVFEEAECIVITVAKKCKLVNKNIILTAIQLIKMLQILRSVKKMGFMTLEDIVKNSCPI